MRVCRGDGYFYFAPVGSLHSGMVDIPAVYYRNGIVFAGMFTNIQSDHIIRHLRRPGDTGHYLPKGGMFRYVTSANYFGEIVRMDRFCHSHVVAFRGGFRYLDVR